MKSISKKEFESINSIVTNILLDNEDVIFAYLYGSFIEKNKYFKDIDIAVYTRKIEEPYNFQVDMKIKISDEIKKIGIDISPDEIDFRVINGSDYDFLIELFEKGILLVDKEPELRKSFIEKISMQYHINEIVLSEFYR